MKYDDDEVIVSINRIEEIKDKYSHWLWLILITAITVSAIGLMIDDNIILWSGIPIMVLYAICVIKPSFFKLADISYQKTTITTKYEFDDFKRSESKKEDWHE